jgi:hypothetical protein
MEKCIQDCTDCARVCAQTIRYCLKKGGKHIEEKHFTLLKDCADVCRLSTDLMLRESSFHSKACELCAYVCEECAASCDRIDPADEMMKKCADMCRQCADSCRLMSSESTSASETRKETH